MTWNRGSRISCKWCRQIESWYQQKTIIRLYTMGFPDKFKFLTFGDPERSRSLTEILDAEYHADDVR